MLKKLRTLSLRSKVTGSCKKKSVSEYSQHIEYDFMKEDHKNNFHTKQVRQAMVPRLYNLGSFSFFSDLHKVLTLHSFIFIRTSNFESQAERS